MTILLASDCQLAWRGSSLFLERNLLRVTLQVSGLGPLSLHLRFRFMEVTDMLLDVHRCVSYFPGFFPSVYVDQLCAQASV